MKLPLRKFTDAGTDGFRRYLEALAAGSTEQPPLALLTGAATSLPISGNAEIESRELPTRLEAAEYLVSVLAKAPQADVDHNPAVWNWLSLFFIDQILPAQASGRRDVKKLYRYLLPPVSDPDHFRHYYRHSLAGPYRIRRLHPESGRLFLAGSLTKFDDFNEQIASRQEFVVNPAIVGALDVLYFDLETRKPKRGAASNKRRPGTLRRFIDVIQQFEMTYDLYSLDTFQLLDMLPREFDRWREVGPATEEDQASRVG